MKNIKYIIGFVLMVSSGIGSYIQLATSNAHVTPMPDKIAGYNAIIQGVLFLGLFLWLSHKAIGATEVRMAHKVTNARDTAPKKASK